MARRRAGGPEAGAGSIVSDEGSLEELGASGLEQHCRPGQETLELGELLRRRQRVFLALSGLFLGTLGVLNILGISRFLDLGFSVFGVEIPMPLAIGVLPYPVTFLCTDLISELYGRQRAGDLVWMGLALNLWVVFLLWLGGILPGTDAPAFFEIRALTFGAVAASMVAYLVAQFVDVHLFHWWKERTKGKHLWLRNNGSTLVSQLVDTVAVILVTHYYAGALPVDESTPVMPQLIEFIAAGYVFKLGTALLDTGPFYVLVGWLGAYLRLPPPGGGD